MLEGGVTPDARAKLRAQLRRHEGWERVPYSDTLGNLTLGCGHKLVGGAIPLTDAAIEAILEGDVDEIIHRCERRLLCWPALDEVRQAACVEAAFNGALFASPKAIAALNLADYPLAATELLDGPWSHQVGTRARRLARQIETGEWA